MSKKFIIQIRYQISEYCFLNCEFCNIKKAKSFPYNNAGGPNFKNSFESLLYVLKKCEELYPNHEVSIGYYEESLKNQDEILECLSKINNKKIRHLIKTSGVDIFKQKFLQEIDNRDDVYIDYGIKDFLSLQSINNLDKNIAKYNLTIPYYPNNVKNCFKFYKQIKDFLILKGNSTAVTHIFDLNYPSNVKENVEFTKFLFSDSTIFKKINIINRCDIENYKTIYIASNGNITSEIPIPGVKKIKDKYLNLPESCRPCNFYKNCSFIKNIALRNNNNIENFCKSVHAIHDVDEKYIPKFEDKNYNYLSMLYNNICDEKTYNIYAEEYYEEK
jgi:hypothetical protein